MFRYLPEQASTFASDVDWLHHWITDLSVFFTVAIFGAAILFAIIWRRKDGKHHPTPRILGDHTLEVIWTVVPTIICIFIAVEGIRIYKDIRTPPKNTLDINVTAQQFGWEFEYSNGKKTNNFTTIPVGQPIKYILRSKDVLHSFFVPAMRVKSDALASMYTYVWFNPIKTGEYQGFCTEYCGSGHSGMLFKVNVVSPAEYERWLNDDSKEMMMAKMPPEDKGRELYTSKNCVTCHSIDGSPKVGPSFAKLWNRKEVLVDGSEVLVDENYLEESILYPAKKIVKGYGPLMPAYEGQLTQDEIKYLIAFIKTLEKGGLAPAPVAATATTAAAPIDLTKMTPAERGKNHYQTKLCVTCHSVDGSKIIGPSFKGLYGKSGKFTDGSAYVADDAYIQGSIWEPQAHVVEGYPVPSPMPSYKGQLSESEIADIVEYIKTLK
jgi:cytochrome c oxidase subunit 2